MADQRLTHVTKTETTAAEQERVTHVSKTETSEALTERLTQLLKTAASNTKTLFVTQVYVTVTTVRGVIELACPAIAAPIANIIAQKNLRFIVCPAIAHPLPAMIVVGPNDVRWECPAIAKPIPNIEVEYKQFRAPFTGAAGPGVSTAVLPRRQFVLTPGLSRRRRRTRRRRAGR